MSPEKQRIAIAEACGTLSVCQECGGIGWLQGMGHAADCRGECQNCPEPVQELCSCCGGSGLTGPPPDYLNDLNAMAEAENVVFNKKDWIRYTDTLLEIQPNDQSPIRATAAQRAEAFLKTIGKWKDEHRPVIPPNPEKV